MHKQEQFQGPFPRTISRAATLALAIIFVLALILVFTQPAQAQTYKVLYNFTGGPDGAGPNAGLTIDRAGNLYGTAGGGGYTGGDCTYGCGTVFKLAYKNSNWVFTTLYSFQGGNDGDYPHARVVLGANGTLYGTTELGGGPGWGTVFALRPPPSACKTALCPWTETVLYRFTGTPDAGSPEGDLIFDQAGNIYGTTGEGGAYGNGAVFELVPAGAGWTASVLHSFDGADGSGPEGGVIFDNGGNLYGTTSVGGSYGGGTVFELTPSGSGWRETVLHEFDQFIDGDILLGGLIFDQSGNLYGTTVDGGPSGCCGTAFQLTSSGSFTTIYQFIGANGPFAGLTMDPAGNLYGTRLATADRQYGEVFKLTPSENGWTYTSLHEFTGDDGFGPFCNVILDANGNLYGTTQGGGAYDNGVVWEITP